MTSRGRTSDRVLVGGIGANTLQIPSSAGRSPAPTSCLRLGESCGRTRMGYAGNARYIAAAHRQDRDRRPAQGAELTMTCV